MRLDHSFEDPGRPAGEPAGGLIRPERARPSTVAEATLACPECDAPLLPEGGSAPIGSRMACSYCGRSGPLREFLSLQPPTRPTRVYIRARLPEA